METKIKNNTDQVTNVELAENEVMLASIKKSKNAEKVIIEVCEMIPNPTQQTNVTALLNASDERFNSKPSVRRHYKAAAIKDCKILGITDEQLKGLGEEPREIMIKNPTITLNGKKERVCIELRDTVKPSEFQAADPEKTSKKVVDKSGNVLHFFKGGKPIFQNSELVLATQRVHKIITSDERISWEDYQARETAVVDNSEAINQ